MSSTKVELSELDDRAFVRARVIASGAAVLVLGISYAYAPYAHDGPVVCLLRGLVGIPCPSCGLTRAFCALSHFEVREALRYHALSPLIFAAVAATPFVAAYEVATRRPVSRPWLFSSKLAWGLATLFLAHHVVRTAGWIGDFSVLDGYLRDSWTYAVLTALGLLPG
jgi:hypothetical protein